MADNSKIEWTEATWNVITGCSVESAGCKNCYAMKLAGTRLKHHPSRAGLTVETANGPVWTGEVRFNEQWLDQPLRWKRPRMIFVCAHADLFHPSVPVEWIERVFDVMARCPQHTFQVLTKRAQRMQFVLWSELDWTPLPNVWLGVSVENQKAADERIPLLLQTPAAVRWLSMEPLLGPVDLTEIEVPSEHDKLNHSGYYPSRFNALTTEYDDKHYHQPPAAIDWVVVGGESGENARPMHPDWLRALRDQCAAAGVPFMFKQFGEWTPEDPGETAHKDCAGILPSGDVALCSEGYQPPWDTTDRLNKSGGVRLDGRTLLFNVGKKRAGRLLDGVQHDGYPEGGV